MAKTEHLEIPAPDIRRMVVRIKGKTPYIAHRQSDESFEQLARAVGVGAKQARGPKPDRDPDAEFNGARYRLDDGRDAVPVNAIKKAIIRGAKQVDGLTMVDAKGAVRIVASGDLLPLDTTEPTMRRDRVKNSGRSGSYDVRFRPEYWPWAVEVPVEFNADAISASQVLMMFQMGGAMAGIGDWRPEKDGDKGVFEIDTDFPVIVEVAQ